MATVRVEEGSAHAQAIQTAVQSRLLDINWAPEENDTTLSDYITMMLVNGKNDQDVRAELAGDLLGMGEDDPMVPEFTTWLFDTARALGPQDPVTTMEEPAQAGGSYTDSQMDDVALTPPVDGVPSGPKAMRNGAGAGRGRDRRMMGQLNRQMDRTQDAPDSLRRIRGAAGGHAGRINAHAGRDAPRGPRNQNVANGIQRMMNGGRAGPGQTGPMMAPGGAMGQLDPQNQQLLFMQVMEMQAQMMQQMVNGGQMPNLPQGRQDKSMFDRMDKRGRNGHFKGRQQKAKDADDTEMDVDEPGEKKEPFDAVCRWNKDCTNVNCAYAHQSPAAPAGTPVDLSDTCKFGAKCLNHKCTGRHPSPSIARQQQKAAQYAQYGQYGQGLGPCRFYPNCTKPDCPFEHNEGAQSTVPCRYNPCTKPTCPFVHVDGQKGVFKDKVWTATSGENGQGAGAGGGSDASKSDRFAELKKNENQPEELIKPEDAQTMDAEVPT